MITIMYKALKFVSLNPNCETMFCCRWYCPIIPKSNSSIYILICLELVFLQLNVHSSFSVKLDFPQIDGCYLAPYNCSAVSHELLCTAEKATSVFLSRFYK